MLFNSVRRARSVKALYQKAIKEVCERKQTAREIAIDIPGVIRGCATNLFVVVFHARDYTNAITSPASRYALRKATKSNFDIA